MRVCGSNAVAQAAGVALVAVPLSYRASVEMCCRRSRVRAVSRSSVVAWADFVKKAVHLQYQRRLFAHVGRHLQDLKAEQQTATLDFKRSIIRQFWVHLGQALRKVKSAGKAD